MATNKRFFPVIHCLDPFGQERVNAIGNALANTRIAKASGADGVFLIGHGLNNHDMVYIYENVRKSFPDFFVGVNFLDVSAEKTNVLQSAIARCPAINAIWLDGIPLIHLPYSNKTEVFSGVAFKYIDPDLSGNALAEQIEKAKKVSDVLTTSGDKTGKPPTVEKMRNIRSLVGPDFRLAIASGINDENVKTLLPYADDFLVASSISKVGSYGEDILIPTKVKALAELIHAA